LTSRSSKTEVWRPPLKLVVGSIDLEGHCRSAMMVGR
jgi:hypothetical protein